LKGIKFAFEVYDFKGDGKVDGFYIGDLLRACNLEITIDLHLSKHELRFLCVWQNPTLKTISELGGEAEKGKRLIKIDEFYPLFKKAKDSKDTGGFHDFVEILKLYDKNEDSTILENELFRLLTNLGMLEIFF